MQEELLSKRSLVFVADQVLFRCLHGTLHEHHNFPGSQLYWDQHKHLNTKLSSHATAKFYDFSILLRRYTSRRLTYSGDALRAAEGMLRKLSIQTGGHFFEGLPTPLDVSLLFKHTEAEIRKSEAQIHGRRHDFPSFSWTGWKQCSEYNVFLTEAANSFRVNADSLEVDIQVLGIFQRWILWHCLLEDSKLLRIDSTGRLRKSARLGLDEARLNSPAELRGFDSFELTVEFKMPKPKQYPLLLFWTVCLHLCVRNTPDGLNIFDADGSKCGSFEGEIYTPATSSENKVAEFALIIQEKPPYQLNRFYSLMITWNEGVAERQHVACLWVDLKKCLSPGPQWKTVALG